MGPIRGLIQEEDDGLNPWVVVEAWDGDVELGVAFGSVGGWRWDPWSPRWTLEVGGEETWGFLKLGFVEEMGILEKSLLMKWRRKKRVNCKWKELYRLGILWIECKWDRCKGFSCKKGGEVSLTRPLGRLREGERVSGVRWECEWEMRWQSRWKLGICNYWKMPEIQVSRNDLKILPKIRKYI